MNGVGARPRVAASTAVPARPWLRRPGDGALGMRVALPAALALAVVVPSLTLGGYSDGSRLLFVTLAGLALLCALLSGEAQARATARSAPVLALGLLALLSGLSAAWSIEPSASLRWALVIAGYGAVAVAAGVVARERRGVEAVAALIAGTAVLSAALGLAGLALHEEPFAEAIYGRWRPGGPFEYPATLALLQVAALPPLLYAMTRARRLLAAAAAGGAALSAGTIALSGSRWQLALGAAVLLAAPAVMRSVRSLAAAALVASAALAMYAVVALPALSAVERVAGLGAVCAAAALGWGLAVRARALEAPLAVRGPAAAAFAIAVLLLAGVSIASLTADTGGPRPAEHGRLDYWRGAAETALARPVTGYGADTYEPAAALAGAPAPARYAHDLPLEAWAEIGLPGLLAVLALYAAAGRAVWRARSTRAGVLLGPAVLASLATNLLDWPWHQAGAGALWAAALGAVVAARPPTQKGQP